VALVEATDLTVIERIAKRLGFDYVHAPGNTQASALLTRYTIRHSINHALLDKGMSKSFLEALLIDPAGVEWTFGIVHLHAHATEEDESIRERELQVVLDAFQSQRTQVRPHIVCGDLNANSPAQQIVPQKVKKSTREAWEKNGGKLPRRVIQKMFDTGYDDTLHVVCRDYAKTHGTFSTQHPGQRVDYIFTHGLETSRLKDAWIEYDRLAKYASDHYPVGMEIT
jgi:endonuclease/exonuclease/phosphatase family metal-dependent hydrolase